MKFLVCGMPNLDNQFGRGLKAMGLQVVHTSADPGKFPTDCDAVLLVKCQLSHTKFEKVKNHYKHKKTFSTNNGFSEVKQQIEDWLIAQKYLQMQGRGHGKTTAMSEAFKDAKADKQHRHVHTREMSDKINQVIQECYDAHMNTAETTEYLKSEGLGKADGKPFQNADISGMKWRLGLKGRKPTEATVEPAKEVEIVAGMKVVEPAPEAPKPELKLGLNGITRTEKEAVPVTDAEKKLELIGKVLGSSQPMDRKMILIEEIQSGRMREEQSYTARRARMNGVECVQIYITSISDPKDHLLVTLRRNEAEAVLSCLGELHSFVEATK